MILTIADVDKLVSLLKIHAPVDTGNLRDNGIQGVQTVTKGFVVQIGFESTGQGAPATEDYALFTEIKNRSSKGWVRACCQMWKQQMEAQLNMRMEGSVDQDVL